MPKLYTFLIVSALSFSLLSQNSLGSGYSLNFSGYEDVNVGGQYSGMTLPISISFWIKPNSNQFSTPVFYSSDVSTVYQGWWCQFINGFFAISFGDGNGGNNNIYRNTGRVNLAPQINEWQHVAAVIRSQSNIEIYLNGNPLSVSYTGQGSGVISTNTTNGAIGRDTKNNIYSDAQFDEMSIWNRALSISEIRDLMCEKLSGNEPGLQGYYRFDAGTGTILTDYSPNGNNGTINGATFVPSSAPVGDRSVWTYSGTSVINQQSLNGDSAAAHLNGSGDNGIHLYYVDQRPIPMPTSSNVPPTINHYLGVFTVDDNRSYDIDYFPAAPNNANNAHRLARRPHNASANWTALSPLNNPSISLTNRNAHEQLILIDTCAKPNLLSTDTTVCDSFQVSLPAHFTNVNWHDNSIAKNRTFSNSGVIYFDAINGPNGCAVTDTMNLTVVQTVGVSVFPTDTLKCGGGTLVIDAFYPSAVGYQWSNNSSDTTISVSNSGTYWVDIFLTANCSVRDSIEVTIEPVKNPLPSDTIACDSISISLSPDYTNVTWHDNNGGSNRVFNSSQQIFFNAMDTASGCPVNDTMDITIVQTQNVSILPLDTADCQGNPIFLDGSYPGAIAYIWNTGYTDSILSVSNSGTYWVNISLPGGCAITDTINVSISSIQNPLPLDTLVCDSLLVTLPSSYTNITWNNGSTANSRVFTQNDSVWFSATDTSNGCPVSDTMRVSIISTSSFSVLPPDTVICEGNRATLDAYLPSATNYQWSDGSTDSAASFFTPGIKWVEVFVSGSCSFRDSIQVRFSPDLNPVLEEEFFICPGQPAEPAVSQLDYINVEWSNGSTDYQTSYNSPGTYWVQAEKDDGCFESDTFLVKVARPLDSLQLYNDTLYCIDEPFTLRAPDSLDITWPNGSDTTYRISRSQTVRVEISDGCTETVEFFQAEEISCDCDVVMPDAFTPNGDGLNDEFKPVTQCDFITYRLRVFNRWGQLMYETNVPFEGFDGLFKGDKVPQGMYIYKFNFQTSRTEGNRQGHLMLLR